MTKAGVGTNRYAYAGGDPVNGLDPGGNSWWSTAWKLITNGGDLGLTLSGAVSDFNTVMDQNASAGDRWLAGMSLASELGPLSLRDAKAGKDAVDAGAKKVKAWWYGKDVAEPLRPAKGSIGAKYATPSGFATFIDGNGALVHVSPAGLKNGPDPKFGNRVDHVLAHTVPDPSKPKHTVFKFGGADALALVDEAWLGRSNPVIGDPTAFVVDMGRQVGTNGETYIKVIADPQTGYIVTAFPWSP